MLILPPTRALLGDDGVIEAGAWDSLQALALAWQELEQARAEQAAQTRARCRHLRARALRRGHHAGLALAARRHVALTTALATATASMREALFAELDARFERLVTAFAPEQWLRPELQRCQAAAAMPLLSIRVAPENIPLARAWLEESGIDTDDPAPIRIMADASLGRTCCVLETSTGIIHGRLGVQLSALRQGLQDAASQQIEALCARWRDGT